MAQPLRVLFFDIESSPTLAWVWKPFDQYVDPDRLLHDTFMMTWAAKWSDSPVVYYGRLTSDEARRMDDSRIVERLGRLVGEADLVVGHNGDRFDLPLLNGRLMFHGLPSVSHVKSMDTLKFARRSFKVASNRLDYLAKLLGLGAKLKTDFKLWERAYRGDEEALIYMDRYCREDVRLLERVYDRILPYVKGVPRLVESDEKGESCCVHCGSSRLQRRGVQRTNAATYQRFQCQDCARWSRAASSEPTSMMLRAA